MKITDLKHFQNKLELPYLAHLTRLQNDECRNASEIVHSKIKLAEYVLLKEEIKKHISVRQEITKVCISIVDGTFNEKYNSGAASIDENEDFTTFDEYLQMCAQDLNYFSTELNQFAGFVPQMDEILSEGLNKFFPGLKFHHVLQMVK